MRIRASQAGYLEKTGATWALCQAATASVTSTGQFFEVGTEYNGVDAYYQRQAFFRFDCSVIPASHEIVSATLRVWISTEADALPDTDFTIHGRFLAASYGTLDATDWVSAWGSPGSRLSAATTDADTDSRGYSYIDFDVPAAALASVDDTSTTVDVALGHSSETSEPADSESLQCFRTTAIGINFTPYLYVVTRCQREQIRQALLTRLATIDEYAGYNTTPEVSGIYKPLVTLSRGDFPRIAPISIIEDRTQGLASTEFGAVDFEFGCGIYERTQDDIPEALSQIADDVTRVIESDAGTGTAPLDLGFMHKMYVARIATTQNDLIDNNRAQANITVRCEYRRTINEG